MTCGECGNVTAPGAGFPNHVYCKRFLLHMEKREDASRCRYFEPKPKSNADLVRSMTDEELAEWLKKQTCLAHNYGYECADGEPDFPDGLPANYDYLTWLKKEAKDVEQD